MIVFPSFQYDLVNRYRIIFIILLSIQQFFLDQMSKFTYDACDRIHKKMDKFDEMIGRFSKDNLKSGEGQLRRNYQSIYIRETVKKETARLQKDSKRDYQYYCDQNVSQWRFQNKLQNNSHIRTDNNYSLLFNNSMISNDDCDRGENKYRVQNSEYNREVQQYSRKPLQDRKLTANYESQGSDYNKNNNRYMRDKGMVCSIYESSPNKERDNFKQEQVNQQYRSNVNSFKQAKTVTSLNQSKTSTHLHNHNQSLNYSQVYEKFLINNPHSQTIPLRQESRSSSQIYQYGSRKENNIVELDSQINNIMNKYNSTIDASLIRKEDANLLGRGKRISDDAGGGYLREGLRGDVVQRRERGRNSMGYIRIEEGCQEEKEEMEEDQKNGRKKFHYLNKLKVQEDDQFSPYSSDQKIKVSSRSPPPTRIQAHRLPNLIKHQNIHPTTTIPTPSKTIPQPTITSNRQQSFFNSNIINQSSHKVNPLLNSSQSSHVNKSSNDFNKVFAEISLKENSQRKSHQGKQYKRKLQDKKYQDFIIEKDVVVKEENKQKRMVSSLSRKQSYLNAYLSQNQQNTKELLNAPTINLTTKQNFTSITNKQTSYNSQLPLNTNKSYSIINPHSRPTQQEQNHKRSLSQSISKQMYLDKSIQNLNWRIFQLQQKKKQLNISYKPFCLDVSRGKSKVKDNSSVSYNSVRGLGDSVGGRDELEQDRRIVKGREQIVGKKDKQEIGYRRINHQPSHNYNTHHPKMQHPQFQSNSNYTQEQKSIERRDHLREKPLELKERQLSTLQPKSLTTLHSQLYPRKIPIKQSTAPYQPQSKTTKTSQLKKQVTPKKQIATINTSGQKRLNRSALTQKKTNTPINNLQPLLTSFSKQVQLDQQFLLLKSKLSTNIKHNLNQLSRLLNQRINSKRKYCKMSREYFSGNELNNVEEIELQEQLITIMQRDCQQIDRVFRIKQSECDSFIGRVESSTRSGQNYRRNSSTYCSNSSSIQQLLRSYQTSHIHWLKNISRQFTSQQLLSSGFTNVNIDIERKGYIIVEDLVRFVNLHTNSMYRNKDLAILWERIFKNNQSKLIQRNQVSNQLNSRQFPSQAIQFNTLLDALCKRETV